DDDGSTAGTGSSATSAVAGGPAGAGRRSAPGSCRSSAGRMSARRPPPTRARPNVGTPPLVNQLVGQKVSIVSSRPQTTRTQVRGVRTTDDTQIVFVDTPGIHKPRTLLGERTNSRALTSLEEVDAVCFVIDASEPVGRGDHYVASVVAQ